MIPITEWNFKPDMRSINEYIPIFIHGQILSINDGSILINFLGGI